MPGDTPPKAHIRKRKTHAKSRVGCQNCKIRRIKCDETKPCCRRCIAFGVSCTYNRTSAELQPFEEIAFSMSAPLSTAVSLNRTVLGLLNDMLRQPSPDSDAFRLDKYDLELLNTFHERTVLTIGTEYMRPIYQNAGLKLAVRHPFVMHIALAMTLVHNRADDLFAKQTPREAYHWYQGTVQFNKKLSNPPWTPSERDAIGMASVMLGCIALAHVDVLDPDQTWPLSNPSHTDLAWIKISNGKKEAWRIAEPARPDSYFHCLLTKKPIDNFFIKTTDRESFGALPPEMIELFNLDSHSTRQNNPFYAAAACLGRLLPLESKPDNVLKFFSFLQELQSDFVHLLQKKEPRAILVMLWFQALIGSGNAVPWCTRKRTALESGAMICYLERYHSDIPGMDKLLEFPRRMRSRMQFGALATPRKVIELPLSSKSDHGEAGTS